MEIRVSDAASSLFYSASVRPVSRGNNITSLSRDPPVAGRPPFVHSIRGSFSTEKLPKTTKGPQSNADFVASFLSPSFLCFALLLLGRSPRLRREGLRRSFRHSPSRDLFFSESSQPRNPVLVESDRAAGLRAVLPFCCPRLLVIFKRGKSICLPLAIFIRVSASVLGLLRDGGLVEALSHFSLVNKFAASCVGASFAPKLNIGRLLTVSPMLATGN